MAEEFQESIIEGDDTSVETLTREAAKMYLERENRSGNEDAPSTVDEALEKLNDAINKLERSSDLQTVGEYYLGVLLLLVGRGVDKELAVDIAKAKAQNW